MILPVAGAAIGVVLGFVYTHFAGCATGTCIYSNPWITALFGAWLGYMLTKIITGK